MRFDWIMWRKCFKVYQFYPVRIQQLILDFKARCLFQGEFTNLVIFGVIFFLFLTRYQFLILDFHATIYVANVFMRREIV